MTLRILLLPFFVACYLALIIPFTDFMRGRPFVEKLGYTPQAEVLKAAAADQKLVVAAGLVMKALFYYGSLLEVNGAKVIIPPDYFTLYKTIETAVKVDPYNMDSYYFGQAVMAWEVGRVREANALMEYGMKYRTWDYYLPFFAGFNYAYFLKDYQNAARCYQRAAELSGNTLYANLAGRYMYQSGRTDMALAYLTTMEKSARSDAIKKEFRVRIRAFKEVKGIEEALLAYKQRTGALPASIDDLLRLGYLERAPVDPYGGRFYIDDQGQVKTTSKFAYFGSRADQAQGKQNERN
jgi:tetratricopeptide (TPR) repeat protein